MAVDPELVRRLPAFARAPDASCARLAAALERVTLPAGAILFREGDPADDLYFVIDGRLTLSLALPGRAELSVLSLGPGELTGWSAIIDRERRASTARAAVDTALVRIAGSVLEALCEADHELGYRMMKQLAGELVRRVHETRLQLVDAYGHPDE